MKIYRVVDNAEAVLVTTSELKALRLLRKLVQKRAQTKDWAWVEEETLQ